jgi:AcrR family transcriptional regulator
LSEGERARRTRAAAPAGGEEAVPAAEQTGGPARGPGRPSSGGRDRVLEAALDVLKTDGYAGLTTSKVAARSGQNKALIGYHFGSKDGLVAAVAREVSAEITRELLEAIGEPRTVEDVARGVVDGIGRIMARDEGLARLYFDLASHSVVEPEVRAIIAEMKQGYRDVLRTLLARAKDGPRKSADAEAAAVYLMAAVEGLALEQLERGESPALKRARKMFVRSAHAAVGG